MAKLEFDAGEFVTFDLRRGTISSADKEHLALIPLALFNSIGPSAQTATAAREWGRSHGARLQSLLAASAEEASALTLADFLGGTIAALGLGRLSIELHASALLLRLQSATEKGSSPGTRVLVRHFAAGYLDSLFPQAFEVIELQNDDRETLFFAGNPEATAKIYEWVEDGLAPLCAIRRLAEGSQSC